MPRGCSRSRIPPVIERNQQWIRSALERVEAQRIRFPPMPAWQVPERIAFPAIGREWQIESHPENTRGATVRDDGNGVLHIHGYVVHAGACRAALHCWWVRQGYRHLVPMLQAISRETGWSFDRATVRRQRTRWGSCSRRKTISLNAKLLFLEPLVARYVMIHELCHTQEMNHRRRFWRLVQSACPDCRALNKTLRQAWNSVPAWASDG